MEFAPSLDIILNETLPAMMKVQCKGRLCIFVGSEHQDYF